MNQKLVEFVEYMALACVVRPLCAVFRDKAIDSNTTVKEV